MEMETINLLLLKDPEMINEFLMKYSSSDEIRELFIHNIITGNPLDLEKIDFDALREQTDTEHAVNNNKEILDVLLKSIGLEIERV